LRPDRPLHATCVQIGGFTHFASRSTACGPAGTPEREIGGLGRKSGPSARRRSVGGIREWWRSRPLGRRHRRGRRARPGAGGGRRGA